MSEAQNTGSNAAADARPIRLRDALRQARIEAADRTGVVVDLRDAEVARLEILNEALDPLFAQIPDTIELFDRGISQGETPRLWIDVVVLHQSRLPQLPHAPRIVHAAYDLFASPLRAIALD